MQICQLGLQMQDCGRLSQAGCGMLPRRSSIEPNLPCRRLRSWAAAGRRRRRRAARWRCTAPLPWTRMRFASTCRRCASWSRCGPRSSRPRCLATLLATPRTWSWTRPLQALAPWRSFFRVAWAAAWRRHGAPHAAPEIGGPAYQERQEAAAQEAAEGRAAARPRRRRWAAARRRSLARASLLRLVS